MAKTIHSMIRVLDEARAVEFYKKAFGLEIADRLDFDDFTLVYLSNSEAIRQYVSTPSNKTSSSKSNFELWSGAPPSWPTPR